MTVSPSELYQLRAEALVDQKLHVAGRSSNRTASEEAGLPDLQ